MGRKPQWNEEHNNNITIAPHFNLKEFQCPCCGRVMLDDLILTFVSEVRGRYGKPVIITSGYRCETHNLYIGGAEDSKHLVGEAVDLAVPKDYQNSEYFNIIKEVVTKWGLLVIPESDHIHVEIKLP